MRGIQHTTRMKSKSKTDQTYISCLMSLTRKSLKTRGTSGRHEAPFPLQNPHWREIQSILSCAGDISIPIRWQKKFLWRARRIGSFSQHTIRKAQLLGQSIWRLIAVLSLVLQRLQKPAGMTMPNYLNTYRNIRTILQIWCTPELLHISRGICPAYFWSSRCGRSWSSSQWPVCWPLIVFAVVDVCGAVIKAEKAVYVE